MSRAEPKLQPSWRYRLGTPLGRVTPVRRPRLRSGLFSVQAEVAALPKSAYRVQRGARRRPGPPENAGSAAQSRSYGARRGHMAVRAGGTTEAQAPLAARPRWVHGGRFAAGREVPSGDDAGRCPVALGQLDPVLPASLVPAVPAAAVRRQRWSRLSGHSDQSRRLVPWISRTSRPISRQGQRKSGQTAVAC